MSASLARQKLPSREKSPPVVNGNPRKRLTRRSLKRCDPDEKVSQSAPADSCYPESNDLRDRVFSNDVVWRILSSCLNFADLKACRAVCKIFNQKVLDSPRFKNHAELRITTDDLKLRKLGKTREVWKCLRVEVKGSQSAKDPERLWLEAVMADVGTLKLSLPSTSMRYKCYRPPQQLWTAPRNLRKLSVDAQLLWDDKVFEKIGESLATLTELEILRPSPYRQDEIGYISGREREMKALPNLAPRLTQLEVLRIRTNMADSPDVDFWTPRSLIADIRSLLTVLHGNKSHLKELELDDSPLWSHTWEAEPLPVMKSVFPKLQSLQLRLVSKEANTFVPFLRDQPLLTKLDVTIIGPVSAETFNCVKERSELLTSFGIKGSNFTNCSRSLCEFLRSSKLKEFRLNCIKKGGLTTAVRREIIESLPRDIKSVSIRVAMDEPVCDAIDPVILERFNPLALTELTLIRCHEFITDRTLEFICRNFKLLQRLNLSYADERCTDYGFTGRKAAEEESSFAISDLKGLRSLTLQHCGTISDLTLTHGIKFLELRFLDISENQRVTARGCTEILKNNPSLEVLRVHALIAYGLPTVPQLQRTTNPRMKSVESVYSSTAERDDDDQSESDDDLDNSSDESDFFDWDGGLDYESDSSDYNVCVVM